LLLLDRRYFCCHVGINSRGEKEYGVLALLPDSSPPEFRLLTRGRNAEHCRILVEAMNHGPARLDDPPSRCARAEAHRPSRI
jgi:hypothetical protein